ncbi:MAG: xanthine dehydrogenase FAD-binding subunit XdhB [Desulfitobacteriaceae bacterium]|nr:xanthine dehydrogenase FAD-binding subunit XdhB [Desulfitobacteriaceae bacterium]MDI6913706.1 xanthine dehydrogenase FAD-binding subunit XdhB [Desulfitobacteriaceae bacterium]
MYDIQDYQEALTLSEVAETLARNPRMRIIAGGTDLLIKLHGGQIKAAELLSIRKIEALSHIEKMPDGAIGIGPLATFTQITQDPVIKTDIPLLAEAAVSMGGPQIRNIATIGGNVCNGATSADSASSLFALEAELTLISSRGTRVLPISEFYLGPGKVDLRAGELLTEIRILPQHYVGFGGHYIKFAMRKAMDIATLGVAVLCKLETGNILAEVKIGLGVAGPTPLRCLEAEAYAAGKAVSMDVLNEVGRLAIRSAKARTSWRASKEYREHLIQELVPRALREAIVQAGGGEIA